MFIVLYWPGNYLRFYYAIKRAFPDIKIISNCDGSSRQLDHPTDYYDFHVNHLCLAFHFIILLSSLGKTLMYLIIDKVMETTFFLFSDSLTRFIHLQATCSLCLINSIMHLAMVQRYGHGILY